MNKQATETQSSEGRSNQFQYYFALFMLFVFLPSMFIIMTRPAKTTIEKLTASPETFNTDYVAIYGHVTEVLEGPTYIVSDENGRQILVVKKSNAPLTVSQDSKRFVGHWMQQSDGSYYLVIR